MANFAYIARSLEGERVTGRLAGASEQAILAELASRQLAPVEVIEVHERQRKRRVSTRRLANAYHQLSDLLKAGVPLLRALRLLGRSRSNPRLASVMNDVADAVAGGGHLADALGAHDDVFPSIQVAMIRAGERGAFLDQVLARMGDFLEHQADMRGKVVGSMIYPIALLLLGVAIITFALVFLVPKFETFYSRIEIPLPTRMLLAASSMLTSHWLLMTVLTAIVATGLWWLYRRPAVKRAIAVGQLRLPVFGKIVRDLAIGRFTRILGTLLENGIPLLPAMQISRDAVGHVLLAETIDRASEAVRAGGTLSQTLSESGLFPEETIEIIRVGESANNLPPVLLGLADSIEKRIDRVLTALVRMLEPVLLLLLAGMVLFLFIALVVPMLRLSSSI